MSLTQTVATTIKTANGGTVVSQSTVFTADVEKDVSNQVSANGTLDELLEVDVSRVESWYIYCDQEVIVTPKLGASATGDGPFTIPAKKALYWNTARTEANPFQHDFDKLHISNVANAVVANFKAGFLVHAT